MLRKTFFPMAILLCLIAVFSMSGRSVAPQKKGEVFIKIVGFPEGEVTATGALEFTGTNFMTIRSSGKSKVGTIHCTNSIETPDGTFTLLMDCQFATVTGQWRIVDGTGAYEGLKANGSLIMYVDEEGRDVEDLVGKVL